MRKIFSLCLCLLSCTMALADNVIKLNDESLIEDFTSIYFEGNGNIIILFADNSTVSVNMNILTVLPNAESGIEELLANNVARISQLVGDQLVIEGATAGDLIRIYSTNGALMTQCKATDEHITINLSNCKKGTYILCIGSKVIKFNK